MKLPVFFGHKRSINLLPRDEFEGSTMGVVLSWALVFGKWAVILTQLVVMGAFLWRFSLDRELTDLRKSIAREANVVKSYEQIERDFVLAQKQVAQIKTTLGENEQTVKVLREIERVTPNDVWYDRMAVSTKDMSLTAYAASLPGFGRFLSGVQASPIFTEVKIGKIESSGVRGAQLQFEVAMNIASTEQEKKK